MSRTLFWVTDKYGFFTTAVDSLVADRIVKRFGLNKDHDFHHADRYEGKGMEVMKDKGSCRVTAYNEKAKRLIEDVL
ncbi:MAG: hypothetical protein WC444_04585 [Candidatus Paceibacterota bacterium]